ncbi:DNA-binding protein, partial [Bacillus anthracis]
IYNLAKGLNKTNQYEEAKKYIDKGIKLAINLNTLYLLGEQYYEKGSNLLKLEQSNKEEIADNMKTALFIFELTKKEKKLQIIKEGYFEKHNC